MPPSGFSRPSRRYRNRMIRYAGALDAGAVGAVYLDYLAVAPRFAVGLTKLVSSATLALRLRRSNDSAELDIGFVGDAIDTAAISSFVSSNSAYVTVWYDQTGNSEHATQSTAANQPRIVNAGTYQAEVEFDGSNDWMKFTDVTMGNMYASLHTRIRRPTLPASEVMFETSTNFATDSGQSFVVYSDGNEIKVGISGAVNTYDSGVSLVTAKVMSVMLDKTQTTGANEVQLWQDGVQKTSSSALNGNTTNVFANRDLYVAGRAGASLFADQFLQSIVLYNEDVSSLRTAIESVLGR